MNPSLHNVDDLERIKQLEAELADFRQEAQTAIQDSLDSESKWQRVLMRWEQAAKEFKARAEKAEAEVERLRMECRAHTRNSRVPGHTHPEPCCLADHPGYHCPERGGRESGFDRGEPKGLIAGAASPAAAAEPAAPSDEPLPRRGSRKERDG